MIKLVATDIDGTLLQSGEREVPEAVFVQIDRLLKKGILFAAASGRQYSNLKNLFAPKAEEMTFLCENGAILYRKDQILKKRPMPRSRAEALAKQILANDDIEVLISGANTSYLMPKVGHPWIMKNSALDQAGFGQSHEFLRAESVEEILKKL